MKDNIKSALCELIRAVLAALVSFVTVLLTSSCGSTTRATISNRAEGTSTTVTITTNNPSQIDVAPDVNLTPSK